MLKPLWENLVSRDPKTGELIPMLAERWQVTDGGRTWKFQLRKGVHFHDGRELTAEDVKFTFSSIAREGSANSLSTEFRLIKSMEIESRYAITIHFDKPSVVFANKVNQGLFASVAFIQSKSSIESAGEDGAERRPIGTGPWKFVEHVRGDRIVYEAVEGHWRATPNFKRLVMLKVPEPATRMAMLRAGSVDVIEIGGEYVDELKKVGVRTLTMPNVAWVYVILGGQWPTKPSYDRAVPWAQPDLERARKVRLALNLAVDKNAVMQRVMGNLGSVTGSWLAYPNDPWTTDALKNPYPYDPARAKALLSEAGYPKGFDVTMNLTAWPGRGYLPDVGEAVATYWEKIGIRVKRRPVDQVTIVDGTLVPTRDHRLAAQSRNYRYSANLLVAIHNVSAAEAFVLGMKAGLPAETIFRVQADSAGSSRMFQVRGPMMVAGKYGEATMRNDLWQKDMKIIGEFAAKLGVPTPLFNASAAIYNATLSQGHETHDTAAVCAVLERMAGVRR